jgi:hypothetical protein
MSHYSKMNLNQSITSGALYITYVTNPSHFTQKKCSWFTYWPQQGFIWEPKKSYIIYTSSQVIRYNSRNDGSNTSRIVMKTVLYSPTADTWYRLLLYHITYHVLFLRGNILDTSLICSICHTSIGFIKCIKEQQTHFKFIDVLLLQYGHQIFRPPMWPFSVWFLWEQEYSSSQR